MKTRLLTLSAIAATLVAAHAPAFANADLAKARNCMTCHSIEKKVLGPAFQDVAAKYAKVKDAEKALALKIVKGGAGVWGAIPMPANVQVKDDEALVLAHWVLTLQKPSK